MTDHLLLNEFMRLACCAILRQFNRDQLWELGIEDDAWIRTLLDSERVTAVPDIANSYRLREDLSVETLKRLRTEHPHEEIHLHTRAFRYFLAQMERPMTAERRQENEDQCLYHLDILFFLIGAQMDWQTIQEYISATRNAQPQQVRHHRRLALYEGYAAIRTQQYAYGEAILTELLAQDALDPDVRLKALRWLSHRN